MPTYLKICWYDYYKSHVVWQSVNKIQTTLQMTGQASAGTLFKKAQNEILGQTLQILRLLSIGNIQFFKIWGFIP